MKITVHGSGGEHYLRVHLNAGNGGIVRFESEKAYTKVEADYRAVIISSIHGFERDELPTQPDIQPYPIQ